MDVVGVSGLTSRISRLQMLFLLFLVPCTRMLRAEALHTDNKRIMHREEVPKCPVALRTKHK